MNHRYGRHGSDAWRHLQEHRFKRFTHSFVPEARVVVVHVHFKFTHRERIFVVALDENNMQIKAIGSADIVNEYPTTTPLERLKPDPLKELKYHARMDAARKVEEDLANFGDPSTKEELLSYTRSQGLTYARDHVTVEMAGGRNPAQLRDIYVDAFLEEYGVYLESSIGNGSLPDEHTRRIKRKAREDRAENLTQSKQLSSHQIHYQAAIRALEMLHLDTRNHTTYLAQIEKFADLYVDEYANHKEVERSQRDHSPMFHDHLPS